MFLMLNLFNSIWNKIDSSLRNLSAVAKGGIMFVLVFASFISLIYALKGGKGKVINNWFCFYVCLVFIVASIVFTICIF